MTVSNKYTRIQGRLIQYTEMVWKCFCTLFLLSCSDDEIPKEYQGSVEKWKEAEDEDGRETGWVVWDFRKEGQQCVTTRGCALEPD